jgi:FMN-dependent dehydrogenase
MSKGLRAVASPRVINIDDLRRLARRRLPRVVFDYPDGGAEGEVTLRENCRVFDDVTFRPRQAVAISHCELGTRVLGLNLSSCARLKPEMLANHFKQAVEHGQRLESVPGFVRHILWSAHQPTEKVLPSLCTPAS